MPHYWDDPMSVYGPSQKLFEVHAAILNALHADEYEIFSPRITSMGERIFVAFQ